MDVIIQSQAGISYLREACARNMHASPHVRTEVFLPTPLNHFPLIWYILFTFFRPGCSRSGGHKLKQGKTPKVARNTAGDVSTQIVDASQFCAFREQ